MEMYDIKPTIFTYKQFYEKLSAIQNNTFNQFSVIKHKEIGESSCGFPLEHYTIGNGDIHICYMAGAHGNEIIGVSYILHLMRNLALGRGEFASFRPDLFTIHFLPCQNPEGYFTTTYALEAVMKELSLEERTKFCYDYYATYREENVEIEKINQILRECFFYQEENYMKEIVRLFWSSVYKKCVGIKEIVEFLKNYSPKEVDVSKVEIFWKKNFGNRKINTYQKRYQEPFCNLTIDCIPEVDEKHRILKKKLQKLYGAKEFPMCTLANFLANADGVNLNDNNPYYFKIMNEQIKKEGILCANPMYNYPKSKLGPIGTTSVSCKHFSYAPENLALLNFLDQLGNSCYAFFNLHGTGGYLYVEPFYEEKQQPRDFSFYINNRIATEYLKGIEETYVEKTGKREEYFTMSYPSRITGLADMLRSKYPGHFLVELSRSGGNPIGPFIEPNYTLTMEANFKAFCKSLDVVLELVPLYEKSYLVQYDKKGKVFYEVQSRKRNLKKDYCE